MIELVLSCLRRAQDLTVPFISKALHVSLPESLDDVAEKLSKYEIDEDIKRIVAEYWQANGCRVRGYRILSQHKAQIASNCYVVHDTNRELKFCCLLPNNPFERAAQMLSYEPGVHAYPYLRDEYFLFLLYSDKLGKRLVECIRATDPEATGGPLLVHMNFKVPLSSAPQLEIGTTLPRLSDIDERIAEHRRLVGTFVRER
jgi:hypothetical protein